MTPRRWTLLVVTIVVGFYSGVALAWTGPTGTPPNSNIAAPINVSSTFQDKPGAAWFDGGIGVNSGSQLCIGSTCITSWPAGANGSITGPYVPNYAGWASSGTGAGGAAIYNDNGSYKSLMVVGNSSAGGLREVHVWDDLTVNNNLYVNSTITSPQYCIGASCITSWPSGGTSQWTTSGSNIYYNSGFVGIGTASPSGALTIATYTPAWSGFNFGKQLIIAGGNNPTIGILDSTGNNPWAITNGGDDLEFSQMPALSDGSTGPSTRLTLKAGGNVGIGTGSPSALLEVNGTSQFDGAATFSAGPYTNDWFRVNGSNGIYWSTYGGGWYMTDSTYLRTYNSKGVFAENAAGRGVQGASENGDRSGCFGSDCVGGTATTHGVYGNGTTWAGYFSGPVYMSGKVGIGTGSPQTTLDVNGDISVGGIDAIRRDGNNAYLFPFGTGLTNEDVYVGGGTTINLVVDGNAYANAFLYSSDERLKTDIAPLTDNLSKILQIQPVSYLWKDPSRGTGEQIGFIAQQVQPIVPGIMHTDASTTLESIDYARMTPLLVGSVQELDQKILTQQGQIDTQQQEFDAQQQSFEQKIDDQQKQIDSLESQVEALQRK